MSIRMLPIAFVFNRFPRLVRELAGKLGKKVELRMSGEGTELDKGLIERIADPLTHLVRNSLDHGVEPPAARAAAGKPESGSIELRAYHHGGNIITASKRRLGSDVEQAHPSGCARRRPPVHAALTLRGGLSRWQH